MPQQELERLQAVNRFLKLEISKEKELQEIVDLAADICQSPVALLTLLDMDTQYFLFKKGVDIDTTTRKDSFCQHVISGNDIMIVPDTSQDKRFLDNPLVTGAPNIRFYAGAPLTTQDGHNLGSLCVVDSSPKKLSSQQQKMLQSLSKQAIQLLEFDASLKILKDQYIEAKRSEIEFRSFFESSIDCHLLLGKGFEVLTYNKALKKLIEVNYAKPLARGELMSSYLSADLLPAFYGNYQKALQGTSSYEQRQFISSDKDRQGWWIMKYEPAFNDRNEIIGVSVNSTDITSRVLKEQRVLEQNESLKNIAFIQSHELRRPVASILGLMNILRIDGHTSTIAELDLMSQAVNELDEKIKLIVDYTTHSNLE